jgi:chromosome segregation ATPase
VPFEGLLAIAMVFSIPIVAIVTSHRRKMLELTIRLKGEQPVRSEASGEIGRLRAEVEELRDTATRFDLSFDAMLQRLDRRVERLEAVARESSSDRQVVSSGRSTTQGGG